MADRNIDNISRKPRLVFRNNFGAIRYILCVAIFISHFNVATGSSLWFPITGYYRVCGFFVMSGFLIYGSYFRSDGWRDYLSNRAWRILPSYLIAVLGCALLLCAVSEYGAGEYFTSLHWLRYVLANAAFLNFIEPTLPGVFTGNPVTVVNASLWTMKVEWMLYFIVIPVVWFTRRTKWKFIWVFLLIFLFSIVYKYVFINMHEQTGRQIYAILGKQFGGQLAFFYSGVLLYVYLDHVKRHKRVIAAVCIPLLLAGSIWWGDADIFEFVLFPLSLAGSVVSLAFMGRWGKWAETFENCSYEVYLFHFPMVQLCQYISLPERIGSFPAFAVVFVATFALSYVVARYVSAPLRRSHRSSKRVAAKIAIGERQ